MAPTASRFEVALLYLAGMAQGLALVTFPAASTIFASPTGFDLSSTQYGAMFIPQVVLAILASAFGSRLARRFALRGVLLLGLCNDVASMALLAASPLLIGTHAAFVVLCMATAALGLGFGATVMALNTLVEGFFPKTADGAVLLLNALLGVGTALAPLLVALFTGLGAWWALPSLMVVLLAMLLLGMLWAPLRLPYNAASPRGGLPPRFWLYAAAVLLYGVAETLNGNWATLYLSTQRKLPAQEAALALTAFWVMVTLGRVLIALLDRVLPPRWIYLALPILLAVAFQIIARAGGATGGMIGFAAAGLACSAFLPFSISFAGAEFPRQAATMSGALIAFYQVGYGVAAFGVGPLRQLAGLDFSTLFSAGSLVAIALAIVAVPVVRHR
ncbi:MAG TPA: MFS transporter [Acetobacteraceae bacterium]|nr:MFS transporter [Acetobacteraceae bacterium]